jgi:hypothetical protein
MQPKEIRRTILPVSILIPCVLLPLNDSHRAPGSYLEPQDRTLRGPYFGQTPPGPTPEIFAPGIVSTAAGEGCIVFSADGRKVVFRRFGLANTLLEGEDGSDGWRIPRVPAPFSRLDYYNGDFTLAPDGRSFFFTSRRPVNPGGANPELSNAWVVQWEAAGWSQPHPLPETVRAIGHQAYPTVTSDGVLYFFSWDPDTEQSDIFRSTPVGSGFSEPENIGAPVNSEYQEYDPFISPDGSYLIFASNDRPGGLGDGDFYVAFQLNDGSWSDPVNMGESINSAANENRPFVTLDGRYFFFTSNRIAEDPELDQLDPGDRPGNGSRDIYWVDARIIEQLRMDFQ